MGQKINPKIFRLGIKKTQWDSRYFEKKKEEYTLYNYQNIEIQSYLKQFFYLNGLILQSTKFHFNDTNLYIHISYFSTTKAFFLINKKRLHQNIKFFNAVRKKAPQYKRLKIRKSIKYFTIPDSSFYTFKKSITSWNSSLSNIEKRSLRILTIKGFSKILKARHLLHFPALNSKSKTSSFQNLPWYKKTPRYQQRLKAKQGLQIERLSLLGRYKTFLQHQKYQTNGILKKNLFLEQVLESLSLLTNKKYHIFLTFQNLNRGMSLILPKEEQDFLKKRILALKRYSKDKFFKDSLNIILIVIQIKNSAKLFAQFLAQQFKFLKRHNYFLTFIKRLITIFFSAKTSKVKGIKICIGGRFNGAPRAKNRQMNVGDIPIQTINKQIDYYETTSYTKNGTFGIKIWVNYD